MPLYDRTFPNFTLFPTTNTLDQLIRFMKKQGRIRFFFLLLLIGTVAHAQNKSIYTNLAANYCRTIEEEGDYYLGVCSGIAGYKLEVSAVDLRESITIIFPSGERQGLDFLRISAGFSSLGTKAEWRMKGTVPIALIIRFNAQVDYDKIISYLIVIKLAKNSACIINIVNPSKTQNQQAQQLADAAFTKPCKALE